MESQFFEALRGAIIASGISQAELARKADVQQASISRFLKRETGLNAATAIKVAEFLGGKMFFPGEATGNQPCKACGKLHEDIKRLETERDALKSLILESMSKNLGASVAPETKETQKSLSSNQSQAKAG